MVCKLNTRCSIVAACNPNSYQEEGSDKQTITANLAIASPLLSRFDLIILLRDERRAEWDEKLADSILGLGSTVQTGEYVDIELYVRAVREASPQLGREALLILSRYYRLLRSADPNDCTRTTPRLLGSLARLTAAHAKLCLNRTASVFDAVMAVLLMERSLGVRAILGEFEREWSWFWNAPPADFYYRFQAALLTKLEIRLEAFESDEAEDVGESENNETKQNTSNIEKDFMEDIPSSWGATQIA